jgi:hypothetical protein
MLGSTRNARKSPNADAAQLILCYNDLLECLFDFFAGEVLARNSDHLLITSLISCAAHKK